MKNRSNELLGEILETLDEAGYTISEVDSEDYCVEIVAKKDNVKLLIKSLINIDAERRESADDLRSLAVTFSGSPLIIGSRMQKGIIEQGALYERFGINVIHPKTFSEAALQRKLPLVYSKRGGLYMKMNGNVLKCLREEQGMSLGELAGKIGVSRKAVYEYEREQMGATLATVAKLEEILGDEIITGINIFDWRAEGDVPEKSPVGEVAKQLHHKLKKIGCRAVGFNYAPIDVHVKNIGVSFLTSEDRLNEDRLDRKVDNAIEVGRILGTSPMLVTEGKRPRHRDITVFTIDEIKKLESVKDLVTLLSTEDRHCG